MGVTYIDCVPPYHVSNLMFTYIWMFFLSL